MASFLKIRTVTRSDVPLITEWARQEGFAPGKGDVGHLSPNRSPGHLGWLPGW